MTGAEGDQFGDGVPDTVGIDVGKDFLEFSARFLRGDFLTGTIGPERFKGRSLGSTD